MLNQESRTVSASSILFLGDRLSTLPLGLYYSLEQLVGLYGFILLCIWYGGAIQTNVICSVFMEIILVSAFPEPRLQSP